MHLNANVLMIFDGALMDKKVNLVYSNRFKKPRRNTYELNSTGKALADIIYYNIITKSTIYSPPVNISTICLN